MLKERDDKNLSSFSYVTRNSIDTPIKDYTKALIENGMFEVSKDKKIFAFNFLSLDEDETGDTSPISNFSNTRFAENLKIKDALKSLGRKKLAGRRAFPVCKISASILSFTLPLTSTFTTTLTTSTQTPTLF
jgi:hypothetical protein